VIRRWAAVGGAAVLLAACSIQPDTAPRVIPAADRAPLDPLTPEGGEAAGSTRVFLVKESDDGQPQLRSVLRSVQATPTAVMQELLKGPNPEEEHTGVTTALPRGLSLRSAGTGAGVMTVDVTGQLLDEQTPQLLLGIAQIVFTASELSGVRAVRVRVNGINRPWPDGQGELTAAALTVYDFPGLAESTQPAYPPIPSKQPSG
jgi:spore germination protein GerM